jgi:hypothetical protein
MVAALKYRYVTFGKTNLTFKGFAENSKHAKPHRPVTAEIRARIDNKLSVKKTDIKWRLACKLLYDLGAR